MKKKILGIAIIVIAGAVIYGIAQFNKAPQNMRNVKPDFRITAGDLYTAYQENEEAANEKYLDKLVEIEGTIQSISVDNSGNVNIYLDAGEEAFGSISCSFDSKSNEEAKELVEGSVIKVKGVCTGYLMDVVLNKCVLIN